MSINALAGWLGVHFPLLYRFVRPLWRLLRRLFPRTSYWKRRKHFNYYQEVLRLAKAYVPSGKKVIDVGTGQTEYLRQLSWFERRVALDSRYVPPQAGIENVMADFMTYDSDGDFDLVLCLQVLEHLEAPGPFAKKLLTLGRTIIITVPHRWPRGAYEPHPQDPIDEAKLEMWTGVKPIETVIATNGKQRLIAIYQLPDGGSGRAGA